jgi:predicted ATP-dependent endonuclease of OLD family
MSYIGRCQLSGYKSIKNVSCEFSKGLNIIIGNNGSGKTNLLEFIYKVLNRDYVGFDVFNAELEIVEGSETFEWVATQEAKVYESVNAKIQRILGGHLRLLGIAEPDSKRNVFVEFVRFSLPNEIPVLATEYNPKYSFTEKRLLINGDRVNMPFVIGFWLPVLFTFSPIASIKSTDDLTDDLVYHMLVDKFESTFGDIQKILSIYTPIEGIRFSNAVRVTRIDATTFEIRNIVFEYRINNQWFAWKGLSDGTKRLIYTIFSIYGLIVDAAQTETNKEIVELPIAFIEEPELGIHPHQLHLLMTLLKERAQKQQIIITTHSPQVLDVLGIDELDQILIAETDAENGTVIRKLTEKETEKAKIYLQDEGMLSDYWRFSDLQKSKQSK